MAKEIEVVVSFEGGQTRTYTGKDAAKNAKEFCSKRDGRKIVKGEDAE